MLFVQDGDPPVHDVQRAQDDSYELWREIVSPRNQEEISSAEFSASTPNDSLLLDLAGWYRVRDGNEFPCAVHRISPAGIHIKGSRQGALKDRCTANIASVGIVEGMVVQAKVDSLTIGVIAPPSRIDRLARRLRWHIQRSSDQLPERRASQRVEMARAAATLKTSEGRRFSCEVFDISEGGAALHLGSDALYFWGDQPIELDGRPGRVLRHFPGGFVIRFD